MLKRLPTVLVVSAQPGAERDPTGFRILRRLSLAPGKGWGPRHGQVGVGLSGVQIGIVAVLVCDVITNGDRQHQHKASEAPPPPLASHRRRKCNCRRLR
jgi:hypothetical protein